MKKISKNVTSTALAILIALSVGGCKKPPQANVSIKSLYPTEKIEKTEDISSRSEGKVEISLSKGESEGDQFAIITDLDLSGYTFDVSDLTFGENVISKENVEVSKMIYTECNDRHNSGAKAAGWYADAVVPLNYIVQAGENVLEKDINNLFWVDVDAPKDAAAGVYSGVVTLKTENQAVEIPMSVEVYDFEIRDLPYMQASYSIWLDGNFMMYGELESNQDVYMRYYDTLLEYNVCPNILGDTADEFVATVREYYDKITTLRLPVKYIGTTKFEEDYYEEVLLKLAIASIEDGKNYFEKAFHRLSTIYDEFQDVPWRVQHVRPTIEKVDIIEQNVVDYLIENNYVESQDDPLAKSILNLRHNMTAWYDEEWSDVINMYCTVYDRVRSTTADLQQMQKLINEEDKVFWTYGCIKHDAYPNPTSQINDYLVSARDLFWFNYEYDIKGDLFWCVNQYCHAGSTVDGMWKPHPDLYEDASHDRLTNGDGYLVYPGINYGSKYPFPSHRLIVRRDGIDDHTYLSMLGEKYKAISEKYGANIADAKNFTTFMNDQLLGRGASKLNDAGVLSARDTVAKAIILAEKTGLIFNKLEVKNNELVYEIYTDGSSLKLNGVNLSGENSGSGKLYKGAVELNANGKVIVCTEKDGVNYSLDLFTPVSGNVVIDAETQDSVKAFKVDTQYGSSVALANDVDSIKGNCARINLSGYNFKDFAQSGEYDVDQLNSAYKPGVKFGLGKGLNEISSVEFYVYNEQDSDVTIEVFLEKDDKGMLIPVSYDKVILYGKTWTKIVIDNFYVLSLNKGSWKDYNSVGFRINNLLTTDKTAYAQSFLVDEIMVRGK